jgi:hypothetical protein
MDARSWKQSIACATSHGELKEIANSRVYVTFVMRLATVCSGRLLVKSQPRMAALESLERLMTQVAGGAGRAAIRGDRINLPHQGNSAPS